MSFLRVRSSRAPAPACERFLLRQPRAMTVLMKARRRLAVRNDGPSCPGTIGFRQFRQESRQSTSRSRIHLSMRAAVACRRRFGGVTALPREERGRTIPAVKEKHSAGGREGPRADRPIGHMARDHNAGGQSEPHAARMGELLRGRNRQQGVSSARCLRGDAVAPVVAPQAQSQATKGRELSTLAPLRALRARTPDSAWARRAVDEGVRSCPRAGCRKSACPVR